MPADTRSSRKVKHRDAERAKEGQFCSDNTSEGAIGSKRSTRDTSSTKRDGSSPASTRKSERLKHDVSRPSRTHTPSPLRRSGRVGIAPKSGKSGKSPGLSNAAQKSDKKKGGINEMGKEANEVAQSAKKGSNGSSQAKKRMTAHRYLSLFEPSKKKAKPSRSDSAKDRRQGDISPCSSSNSESYCTERNPVAEDGKLNRKVEKSDTKKCSKVNQGSMNSDGGEGSMSALKAGSIAEPHSGQKHVCAAEPCNSDGGCSSQISKNGKPPLDSPVQVPVTNSENQMIDDQLPKDTIPEDNGGCETQDGMDNSCDSVANVQEELDQMNIEESKCITCKSTGKLLYCSGRDCGRGCHLACINSHCKDANPATWLCPWCTKKKIDTGVYSVSEGIESIWNVQMKDDQDLATGDKRQKEYFVKYKGLAHAHNRWLPETQLLQEAPDLISEFVSRGTAIKWIPEWTVPHRLLLKRSLILPNSDGCVAQEMGSTLSCQHEWLVKWCNLDYSNITWELESAVFLQTSKAQDLIHEYQRRHEKAKRAQLSQEIQERTKCPPIKLSTFPSGCDASYLNNLRDYWTKCRNALAVGGQDHVAQTIYFLSSLQANVSRPFLIISPCSSISKWEAELKCLAPSMDVVVYDGDRDAREMIQRFEFYKDGLSVMFEVLLSSAAIIKEDLEFIKHISWEVIIIDEHHTPLCFGEHAFIKKLASDSMLVLLMEQINDNVADYCNILSLLKCKDGMCGVDDHTVDSSSSISELKEKLSPFIIHGCKSVPSRLIEYWVPAQMSNMQLEQYCFSLLSNSTALCSKHDPVGVLPNILISVRKCCDHPYTVDETLQAQFAPEMKLDIGVKASGKLHLLDAILQKMKDNDKKVVILFKSLVGVGGAVLGDILDDFVRQRFGENSYERLDSGGVPSKRQACINRFNKESGIFVFLLETRACSSSVKLASVDAVIIFGSDWNPHNDLRALQKIKMDSKAEQINVFRLYTTCSIEEKVLFLSKRNVFFESTLQGISFTNCHMLLAWGASYLFRNLKEFHDSDGCTEILPKISSMEVVVEEFMSLVHKNGSCTRGKYISRASQSGGCYSKDISLLGEECANLEGQDQPRYLWRKLLEGIQPTWRYLSLSSQRSRKRVQYFDETADANLQTYETTKRTKRRVSINGGTCSSPSNNDAEKEPDCAMKLSESVDGTLAAQKFQTATSTEKLRDEKKYLYQMLNSDMAEIFSTLGLQEDVQKVAEQFLQYLINNTRVDPDLTETLVQAFKISVCWSAAALRNRILDHTESLALARERLKFNCNDDEVESVFSKMQPLRNSFLIRSGDFGLKSSSKGLLQGTEGSSRGNLGNVRGSTISKEKNVKAEVQFLAQDGFNECVFAPQSENEISKYVKKLKKHCRKRLDLLIQDQLNRVEEFHKLWQEKKELLEKDYRLKTAVISTIHSTASVSTDKLKDLKHEHKQKVDQLDSEMTALLKDIEAKNQAEKEEEEKKATQLLDEFNSRAKGELSDNLQLKGVLESCREEEVPTNSSSLSGTNLEEENANVIVQSSAGMQPESSENPICGKVAENSGSVAAAAPVEDRLNCDNGVTPATDQNNDNVMSADLAEVAVVSKLGVQSSPVLPSAVASDDIGQAAATGCSQSSGGNSTTPMEIKEREVGPSVSLICTAPRAEQHDEDINSVQARSSPSMVNQSAVQPVGNQHEADNEPLSQEPENPSGRLNASSEQHGCAETLEIQNSIIQDVIPSSGCAHETVPPEQTAGLMTTSVSPVNMVQTCLPSSVVLMSRPAASSFQEDQSPPNLSVTPSVHLSSEASLPRPDPPQVENHLPGRSLPSTPPVWGHSLDFGKESDPLYREYERIRGESSQAIKSYEEMVSRLKLECDKEMEEIVAQIRKKYNTRLQEVEASFLLKKNEFDHYQRKVLMNMALAEAFRSKCIDHRAAQQGAQQVPSGSTQHPSGRSVPQTVATPPMQHGGRFTPRLNVPPTQPQRGNNPYSPNFRLVGNDVNLRNASKSAMGASVQALRMTNQSLHSTRSALSSSAGSHGGLQMPPNFATLQQTHDSFAQLLTHETGATPGASLLPSLPEVARNFESCNLSEFGSFLDAQPTDPSNQTVAVANDVVCLSDDE